MHTYQNLKARMKAQTPSNWSPALKPKDGRNGVVIECYGDGLVEANHQTGEGESYLCSRTSAPKKSLDGYSDSDPPPENQTMFQSFEWYTPSWSTPVTVPESTTVTGEMGQTLIEVKTAKSVSQEFSLPAHYSVITSILPSLAALGVTSMWLPPGCKASYSKDTGYGVYDLYDLGEFDSKGSRSTKWGSKEELVKLGQKAEEVGIGLLWDAVLNHRAAADDKENAKAVGANPKDRTKEIGPARDVVTWSRFNYAARNGLYSKMTYNWRHFTGIDWDDSTHTKAIFKYVGDKHTSKPGWATDVDAENGNYDYLMFADVDYSQADVQADVLNWSTWLPTQVPGLRGMRLDAIKHYSARFQYKLIKHMRENARTKDWFFVGEYWNANSKLLARHIDGFAGHMHLFDVKLVYNFCDFASGHTKDLRNIFKGSLVELKPDHAVTFVTNHDTQATQSLASPVAPWFHAHAYALILLRTAGLPCIFHGDVFGTLGPKPLPPSAGHRLMRLSLIRRLYAYGPQHDFFVSANCIAWSREGHVTRSQGAGIAVLLNGGWSWKGVKVYVGRRHRGEVWTDLMGWSWDEVSIDDRGYGVFRVPARTIGVWTCKTAVGREVVDALVWPPMSLESDGVDSEET